MTKLDFIFVLSDKLSSLPNSDVVERINFYTEMIEDRIEEGLSEEDAVAAIGSVDEIAEQIKFELESKPEAKPETKAKTKRKLSALEIILLIIGAPVWGSLLIAAAAVVLSLYVSAWAIVILTWSVFASLVGCGIGGIAGGAVIACSLNPLSGIALIGCAIACVGLSIFTFYGSLSLTKLTAKIPSKFFLSINKDRR